MQNIDKKYDIIYKCHLYIILYMSTPDSKKKKLIEGIIKYHN